MGTFQDIDVNDIKNQGKGSVAKLNNRRTGKKNFTLAFIERLHEATEPYHGDREYDPELVLSHNEEMKNGRFLWETASLGICRLNGVDYRFNGQHVTPARIMMGADYECEVDVLYYDAKSEDELQVLFASKDRHRKLTPNEVLHCMLSDDHALQKFDDRRVERIASGLSYLMWPKREDRSKNRSDIGYVVKKHHRDLFLKVCRFLNTVEFTDNRPLYRQPVIAAMFATFESSPRHAKKFWESIAKNVFESENGPQNRLRRKLFEGANGEDMTAAERYNVCLYAWNAYREGRELRRLTIPKGNERLDVA